MIFFSLKYFLSGVIWYSLCLLPLLTSYFFWIYLWLFSSLLTSNLCLSSSAEVGERWGAATTSNTMTIIMVYTVQIVRHSVCYFTQTLIKSLMKPPRQIWQNLIFLIFLDINAGAEIDIYRVLTPQDLHYTITRQTLVMTLLMIWMKIYLWFPRIIVSLIILRADRNRLRIISTS